MVRGAARGGSGGQRRQARLGRAGGVGQTVAQSAVLVLQRRAGLGRHGLRLLQQGPRLWPGLLALQAGVLVVLLLLRSGSTLILTEKEGKKNLGECLFVFVFFTLSGGTYPKKKKDETELTMGIFTISLDSQELLNPVESKKIVLEKKIC